LSLKNEINDIVKGLRLLSKHNVIEINSVNDFLEEFSNYIINNYGIFLYIEDYLSEKGAKYDSTIEFIIEEYGFEGILNIIENEHFSEYQEIKDHFYDLLRKNISIKI